MVLKRSSHGRDDVSNGERESQKRRARVKIKSDPALNLLNKKIKNLKARIEALEGP